MAKMAVGQSLYSKTIDASYTRILSSLAIGGIIASLFSLIAPYSFEQSTSSDNIWYLGKGVKKDSYFEYAMQSNDTNNNEPYNLTIHFLNFDNASQRWNTTFYVQTSKGHILNGTFHLFDANLVDIPYDVQPDIEKYVRSYVFLDWHRMDFAKPGVNISMLENNSLTEPPINIVGRENVTLPAGTFDTWVLATHQGYYVADDRAWINTELPYPVKGHFLSTATCHIVGEPLPGMYTRCPSVEWNYELLAYGSGFPAQVPEIPLQLLSSVAAAPVLIAVILFRLVAVKRPTH